MRRIRFSFIFLFLLPLITTGCSRGAIKKMLMTYYSQEVKFPSQLTKVPETAMNTHSINDSIPKMVIYIDSTECSSCRIGHLSEYESLAVECTRNGPYLLVIILSPLEKDYEYTRHLLESYNNPFPVYLDKNHSFRKENAFIPDDNRFHAFFVDANNRPILVGDPTRSKKVLQLLQQKQLEL